MAKPIAIRQTSHLDIPVNPGTPGMKVTPTPLWSPPKGLDYLNRINRVDNQHCTEMLNMWLDRGVMRSRYGTDVVGESAVVPVMAVINFVTGSGIGFLLRLTTTRIEQWNGSSWDILGGALFTGGEDDYWAYTAFNDTLLFSNGVDGLWEYAPMTGGLQQIEGGPSARHLTTFGGRVIASSVTDFENQIRWSARNNSHDWDGIGSGYEDLLSTPGGEVDQVIGVYPISDTTALMVRTNSIWHVSQSGDPDAPFRFNRLYANIGTRSRHSVDVVPGGIVLLALDDIYVISEGDIKAIGQLVFDRIESEIDDPATVRGVYRPETHEYWLSIDDTVYRYAFRDQGWARCQYPFTIRWMEQTVFHYTGLTWDQAVGTWDEQTENWNEVLGSARNAAFYFATTEAAGNVIEEDPELTTDEYVEDGKVTLGIEVRTPSLLPSSPLEKAEVVEAQLEYEAAAVQTLVWDYSKDGGQTWAQYSQKATVVTTRPDILRAMKTISRESLMLRLRSNALGSLTLISFVPFLVIEAKVEP